MEGDEQGGNECDVKFVKIDRQCDVEREQLSFSRLIQRRWEYRKTEDEGQLVVRPVQALKRDETFIVRAYFCVHNPTTAVYFEKRNTSIQMPYMHTQSRGNCARQWFPCVDNLTNLATYEFEITTHRDAVVVCTGDLVRQVEDELSIMKTSFFVQRRFTILAQSIALAIGPFEILPDPSLPLVTHFYPSHISRQSMIHTVEFMKRLFTFFETYSGIKFHRAFGAYKQVFLDNPQSETAAYSTISLLSSNLILDPKVIERTLETRLKIAKLFCMQAFSHFILPKTWADLWLPVGCAGLVALRFLEQEFGKNELRYYIMQTARELGSMETYTQPLSCDTFVSPTDLYTTLLFVKAPLVVYMIEQKGAVMKQVLSKYFAQTTNATDQNEHERFMSTKDYIRNIKKTYSLKDLNVFARYWIHGTGIPHLQCGFTFDATRNVIEFVVKQVLPFPGAKLFTGNLTVRVREKGGTVNYVMPVTDVFNYADFTCHTKARKTQEKKQQEDGRVGEQRIQIPIEWIRIDPDLEWIRVLSFKQTESMWVEQLEKDRDVVAQIEAARALPYYGTSIQSLNKIDSFLYDKALYYRVRIEVIHAMTKFTNPGAKIAALEHLLRFFKSQFFDDKQQYLLPNDFSDFAMYFTKKEMPLALANLRDDEENTPQEIVDFLHYLLKYNDNSENEYSDAYYVANLLRALAETRTDDQRTAKAAKIIQKHLVLDKLMPSPNGITTITCLVSYADMQIEDKWPLDVEPFWEFLREENQMHQIRLIALECLIRICGARSSGVSFQDIVERVLDMVERDSARQMQACDMLDQLTSYHTKHVQAIVEMAYQAHLSSDFTESRYLSQLDIFALKCRSQTWTVSKAFGKRMLAYIKRHWDQPSLFESMAFLCQSFFGQDTPIGVASENKLGGFIESEVEHTRVEVYEEEMIIKISYDKPSTPTPPPTPLTITIPRTVTPTSEPSPAPEHPPTVTSQAAITSTAATSHGPKIVIKPVVSQPQPQPEERAYAKENAPPPAAPAPPAASRKEKKRKKSMTAAPDQKPKTKKQKKKPAQPSSSSTQPQATPTPSIKVKLPSHQPQPQPQPIQPAPLATEQQYTIEKKALKSQTTLHDAQNEERSTLGETDKNIAICIDGYRPVYARLYHTQTGNVVFRSLPFESLGVQSYEGMKSLPVAIPEKITADKEQRIAVKKTGELAYWIEGHAIVIAFGKTNCSGDSKMIRLEAPCNIFASLLHPSKHLSKQTETKSAVVKRLRRVAITVLPQHDISKAWELEVDLYETEAANEVYRALHQGTPISYPRMFNERFYFSVNELSVGDIPKPEGKKQRESLFAGTMQHGEIALWKQTFPANVPDYQIVVGSDKKNKVTLTEPCFVIGRVVCNLQKISRTNTAEPDDLRSTVRLHLRRIQFSVMRITDFTDVLYTFDALLQNNLSADNIYESLPFDQMLPITILQDGLLSINVKSLLHNREYKYRFLEQGDVKGSGIACNMGELAYSAADETVLLRTSQTAESVTQTDPKRIWATVDRDSMSELHGIIASVNPHELGIMMCKFSGSRHFIPQGVVPHSQ